MEKLQGQATPEQIAEWKAKYKSGIVGFQTTDNKIAYFKNPERAELKMATDAVGSGFSEYNDSLIESCFIGGDDSIIKESKYYSSLSRFVNNIAEIEKGTIVKL